MTGILNALDFIINTITSVWEFFTGIVEHTILLVRYVSAATAMAFQCVFSMPSWLQVFGLVTVTISVLYVILGRQGGNSND